MMEANVPPPQRIGVGRQLGRIMREEGWKEWPAKRHKATQYVAPGTNVEMGGEVVPLASGRKGRSRKGEGKDAAGGRKGGTKYWP